MGVYHLMGLGRSAGAVTGPLTYLAHRYGRWNDDDRRFFARSGEVAQREQGQKVGDIQAIVLFTTREVLDGTVSAFKSVDNPPGRVATGSVQAGGAMKEVLQEQYLSPLWKQGLIAETPQGYTIGPQWELVRPYEDSLRKARDSGLTIEQLAQQGAWIKKDPIFFS